jgi:CheY-like chemotaxis protein
MSNAIVGRRQRNAFALARCRATSALPWQANPRPLHGPNAVVGIATDGAAAGDPNSPHEAGGSDASVPPATVMVIDDERDIRFLLRFVLEKAGYRVVEAKNGASALDMIRAESPALIITDLMMPVMGGGELIEILRAQRGDVYIPAILISACPEQCPADRFDYVMRKPFTPRDLTEIVAKIMTSSLA